jgi:hypothetical protein
MVVIHRTKLGVRIAEIYFSERPQLKNVRTDIVMYVGCGSPGADLSELRTLLVDLTSDEESLMRECAKNSRYEINRAAKSDNLDVDFLISPSPVNMHDFGRFYDVFARSKGRPKLNTSRLDELRKGGALALSVARDQEGLELCYHIYVADREARRARLLYSASHFRNFSDRSYRNMIGRANRYLHWKDFAHLRNHGFSTYDFGGLPPQGASRDLQNIGDFKRSFGGREVIEYMGFEPLTQVGKVVILLSRLIQNH